MFYYNSKWYDNNGECTITEQGKTFTIFSNGQKFMTFEVEQKINNYNQYETERIKAKLEYNRRFTK